MAFIFDINTKEDLVDPISMLKGSNRGWCRSSAGRLHSIFFLIRVKGVHD
jgi:hypothetical protein